MADVRSTPGIAQAVAASALRAQQARMRIIAENLANASSTARTPGGEPYRRQAPVFEATRLRNGATGVKMARVQGGQSACRSEYEPGNPAAGPDGYVSLPNVNSLVEALDMREAQRAYEANLHVIETARAMEMRTLDLLKK